MLDHLSESSHRDDSNKWSNLGFGQEIKELASIEIHFTHLIWRSGIEIINSAPALDMYLQSQSMNSKQVDSVEMIKRLNLPPYMVNSTPQLQCPTFSLT